MKSGATLIIHKYYIILCNDIYVCIYSICICMYVYVTVYTYYIVLCNDICMYVYVTVYTYYNVLQCPLTWYWKWIHATVIACVHIGNIATIGSYMLCTKYEFVQFMGCPAQSRDQYLVQLIRICFPIHGLSPQYFVQSMD